MVGFIYISVSSVNEQDSESESSEMWLFVNRLSGGNYIYIKLLADWVLANSSKGFTAV